MSLSMPFTRGALALLIATGAALQARAGEQVFTFADPKSPGKVVIQMGFGDVRVIGADITEVKVASEEDLQEASEPRSDGLRRLDRGGDHAVTRDGNTVTIVCNGMFGGRRSDGDETDIVVTVPLATSVVIERAGPGDTSLKGIAGDVEIRAAIGDIELEGLSGGAVVETVNGDVRAVFTGLTADRPVSVSAVRGDVELYVPSSARADVRFRTLRGEVLTDFGDELNTRMESGWSDGAEGRIEADVERAAQDQERAAKEQERLAKDAERQAREVERLAREQERRAKTKGGAGVSVPPIPPIPAIPHMPPMAGGRVVAGTLNNGGVDITVTTLHGDILFRKGD